MLTASLILLKGEIKIQQQIILRKRHQGRFDERYKRVTLYLENSIFDDVQELRQQGFGLTEMVNIALADFIERQKKIS